jgi:hypothetical protein
MRRRVAWDHYRYRRAVVDRVGNRHERRSRDRDPLRIASGRIGRPHRRAGAVFEAVAAATGLKPQARIGRAHQPPSSPVSSARTSSSGGGAELHRLEGIALLGLKRLDEGQRTLRAVAQRQQAKAHELRAATCLARLWGEHSKRREARELLAPVYGWFTEGFDGNA